MQESPLVPDAVVLVVIGTAVYVGAIALVRGAWWALCELADWMDRRRKDRNRDAVDEALGGRE